MVCVFAAFHAQEGLSASFRVINMSPESLWDRGHFVELDPAVVTHWPCLYPTCTGKSLH